MIDGLSEELEGLFSLAAELSAKMGHYYLGAEHILLACAQLDRPGLVQALQAGGVSLEKVLKRLMEIMADAPALPTDGRMLITPRLSRLIDAARSTADRQVTMECLLPLIFQEGRSLPCYIIRQMGGAPARIAAHLTAQPIAASVEMQEQLAKARSPALNSMGRDVTRLAAEGKIDPVIGRAQEIRQVALVLARKTKNNPVLIGDAGVGKTAIVEGLALQIASGAVPPSLQGKRIVELPLSVLVAGTQYRGQFEERLNRVVEEVRQNPEVILFIDEVHTLVGAGAGGSGSLDAANILKPALARGDLRCIGATTVEEYHRYVEPDAALERRFSPVLVRELSLEATRGVLEGRRGGYETHHGVLITPEAIDAAVQLAARHVPDRHMPDKALDLLDEACARASLARYMQEGGSGWLAEAQVAQRRDDGPPPVTARDVALVLADRTGTPVEHLLREERTALEGLEQQLASEAIGQEEAARQVAVVLRRLRMAPGLPDAAKARPASLIFAGPAGSGKRALALALAGALYRDEALVTFDLANYRDRIDVEKLLGAPPGYIGHDRESLLSRRLRQDPYVVVTIEHFDAAHPDVQDVFCRGLAEGQIADNQGRTVYLANAVVVVLVDTEEGAEAARRPFGFVARDQGQAADEEQVTGLVRDRLGQEMVSQVHQVIYFPPLDRTVLVALAQRGLERLAAACGSVVFDDDVASWLADEALRAGTGRRALERLIRDQVNDPLQQALASTPPDPGEVLYADLADGKVAIRKEKLP